MNGKFHVLYKAIVKQEGFTAEELQAVSTEILTSENYGATDAVLIVSVIKRSDGGRSYAFPSIDGTTGKEISLDDLFRIWAVLAHSLSENQNLGYGRRTLCHQVHEIVKEAIA